MVEILTINQTNNQQVLIFSLWDDALLKLSLIVKEKNFAGFVTHY